MKSTAKDVDSYLAELPDDRRPALERLRALCLKIGFEECMAYGMPGYKNGGEVEVYFASQKNYISLYVLKQEVLNVFRPMLESASLGKGCIRFSSPDKIDFGLVERMLEASFESDAPIC